MPSRYRLSTARPSSPSQLGRPCEAFSGAACLIEVVVAQARHDERSQQRRIELDVEEGGQLDGAVLHGHLMLRREAVGPAEGSGQE